MQATIGQAHAGGSGRASRIRDERGAGPLAARVGVGPENLQQTPIPQE